jgi:chorismate synthase
MTDFRWLTAGESHGKGLVTIVEGVPAGLPLSEDGIAADLVRRQQGYGRGKRQQIEQDRAEIISGVRHGLTMGSPIALTMINRDFQNQNWRVRMASEPVDEEVARATRTSLARRSTASTMYARSWSARAHARRPPASPSAPSPVPSSAWWGSRCIRTRSRSAP